MGDLFRVSPIWEAIAARETCRSCGSNRQTGYGPIVGAGTETHYGKLTCGDCGTWMRWLPNPDGRPKRDANAAARGYWVERLGGALVCAVCGIGEADTKADFHIHHIRRIEDGGEAMAVSDTFPACQDCHTIAEALRAHQRHARGLSARTPAA